jgi:TM2 domain-containing membrane protein YozV
MTETPQTPEGHEPTQPLPPLPAPPVPPVPPQGPYGYQAPTAAYGAPGFNPAAPYGVHPLTGVPYSDKSKLVAGLLQILIPLGIGRMYMGQTGLGVAQLLVTVFTCGLGGLWPFIDGIVILVGDSKDQFGRPLRS